MARQWKPLHGHKWGMPGIYYRDRPLPWGVRFTRSGKTIYIGSYQTLRAATKIAKEFLEKEGK
jgi:hypothetical protein